MKTIHALAELPEVTKAKDSLHHAIKLNPEINDDDVQAMLDIFRRSKAGVVAIDTSAASAVKVTVDIPHTPELFMNQIMYLKAFRGWEMGPKPN